MNDKNYLVYFLNSMKDELGFEDPEDFKNKVESNLDFKIKMQKFVFLGKYEAFLWLDSLFSKSRRYSTFQKIM